MSDTTPTPSPPPPPPIRFGILGCAYIARKLSRAITLSPTATIHAVGSRSLTKAKSFAAANSLPATTKLYDSYDGVLNDADVDAVYIPLPTSLHFRWAVSAARKRKHVLLEKPTAVSAGELDEIVRVCEECGVQFMDGTMWMHHPRTAVMAEFLSDSQRFGLLKSVQTCYSFAADDDFLENDIRVRPDLDALGALGDLGWYCIRACLFAANYELPKFVTALRNPVKNKAGVILSCGASLHWEDGAVGTFNCSFLSNLTMETSVLGTKGTLHVSDFVIPYKEKSTSFSTLSEGRFTDMDLEWNQEPSVHIVETDLPQEALMVKEFSSLVDGIKRRGLSPDKKWPILSRKTQLVIDAVVTSIDRGFEPVEVLWDR
ncbi:hypothetical protein RND81_02G073900 [Saponaria officinalis]|uniref:Gfo/Idh/MocA-like oxidoreductase N-terminal domain-containing protein n=1 Tax=Saponaria officinalis TaxID=3572 RepID=A0AAW1MNA0_SAPOF